ncbi:MAG: DNA polymerase III subunit delta' [Coriobacteriales bacterium]|nr:DNA polymerase III subunit delta' [Coriobacteriales bacterium]
MDNITAPAERTAVPPFSGVQIPRNVAILLSEAKAAGTLSHAYLLTGSMGSGKYETAMAIALARICPNGGCGECEECRRVIRKSHPDVHWIEPEGAATYLVGQIRTAMRNASLTPIRASNKVFVFTSAEAFNEQAANAFLKTLEEPHDDTSFILIASSRESVIPTIASRCQEISFPSASQPASIEALVAKAKCTPEQARAALAIEDGSIERANELLTSYDRRAIVAATLEALIATAGDDRLELLACSSNILSAIKGACKDMEETYNNEIENQREFLGKGALSELKKRFKRMMASREREMLSEVFAVTRHWLRNNMIAGIGCSELAIELPEGTKRSDSAACVLSPEQFVEAQGIVDRASERIARNVTPRLALDAMLLDIREVIHANRHSG